MPYREACIEDRKMCSNHELETIYFRVLLIEKRRGLSPGGRFSPI